MGDLWFSWTLAADLLNLRIEISALQVLSGYLRGFFGILKITNHAGGRLALSLGYGVSAFGDPFDFQKDSLEHRVIYSNDSTFYGAHPSLRAIESNC
jgi:hypothetical protein